MLTPAASEIAGAYQVHELAVTMTSIIFSLNYVPMTFVAIFMFQKMSPALVFRIAAGIGLFGGWLRVITYGTDKFNIILIGYTIISLAYPIMLSAVTLLCNTWMGDNERTFWIQVCGLTVPIGSTLSFIICGIVMVSTPDVITNTNKILWV